MQAVIVFDDLQRLTPVHLVLPEIMDRLNSAGIPDERIKGICGINDEGEVLAGQERN